MEKYVILTAHELDKYFEQKNNNCLEVFPLEGETQSDENIAQNLHQLFQYWGINELVRAIVTDYAPNMGFAVSQLGVERIRCMAHSLQLVLKDEFLAEDDYKVNLKFEEATKSDEDKYYTKTGRVYLKKTAVPYGKNTILISPSRSHPSSLDPISEPISDSESIFDTPRKILLKKKLFKESTAKKKIFDKIRRIQRQNRYLKKKNESYKTLVSTLKEKFGLDRNAENDLMYKATVVELQKSLIKRSKQNKHPKLYTAPLRKFALTLHYYSTAAYKYVRDFYNKALPHPRTICRWYSSVDAEPGFTAEAFLVLKEKHQLSENPVVCALVFDEMAIRKQKLFNQKRKLGMVNFGVGPVEGEDKDTIATQALVFMLVTLNENWKLPVGYFLISGITAQTKANLIKNCLEKCHEVGVTVVNLTFDGYDTLEYEVLESTRALETDIEVENNCNIFANMLDDENITEASKIIVGYISGYVSIRLTKELKCEECTDTLTTTQKLPHHKLISIKDMGGLCYSTEDVYKICLSTEKCCKQVQSAIIQAKRTLISLITNASRGSPVPVESQRDQNKIFLGIWNACDSLTKEAEEEEPLSNMSTHPEQAVESYTRYPNIPIKQDPSNYWRNEDKYPKLKILVLSNELSCLRTPFFNCRPHTK
ncbi:hypothetical protein evm_010795 [Chilo suppressalis]|nr:hypothetical protein evm_010795 [Chilo suppressalis]